MSAVLKVNSLVKRYKKTTVVNGVSFEVRKGEVFGLLGPNGAGKTTTFKMIMGSVKPDGGEVLLNDTDMRSRPMYQRARQGLGYLAQEPAVFADLTVEQNISALLEARGVGTKESRERTLRLLNEFNLSYLVGNRAGSLSGGERRRLEIARTLAFSPSVLLLDEPFSGIDPKSVDEIKEFIQDLRKRELAILLTDHNVRDTFSITDRASILEKGVVIASGGPVELIASERVRETYLGANFTL